MYLVFVFPKGLSESKSKSDGMKITEKSNINRWIYYELKSTLNVSVSVIQNFDIHVLMMVIKTETFNFDFNSL